ncbi:MAG: NADH-quinone oxidoreductase subunit C, partial [Silvanigrellales bacterium]|nr:NADH-quinone oxidoreductase subunit C [Silvanigrellales bacterium]
MATSFYDGLSSTVSSLVSQTAFTLEDRTEKTGERTLVIPKEALVPVCQALKEQHGFAFLMDVCGVDWPGRDDAQGISKRFDVVYHLFNDTTPHPQDRRLR